MDIFTFCSPDQRQFGNVNKRHLSIGCYLVRGILDYAFGGLKTIVTLLFIYYMEMILREVDITGQANLAHHLTW